MQMNQSRRRFLTTLSAVGAAGLIRAPRLFAAEGPLETNTVRLQRPALCVAALYIAEELLRAEGFSDVRYVDVATGAIGPVARGEVDFAPLYASDLVRAIDAGEPITVLAGVMVGCFELFAREGVGSILELKGKSVGVQALGSNNHALLTLMAAQVGLDPLRISTGSPTRRLSRTSVSSRARSMPSWAFRRSRRICAPAISAASSSTPPWTARGRNISAAC